MGDQRTGEGRKERVFGKHGKAEVIQEKEIKGQGRSSKESLSQDTFSCMKLKTPLLVLLTKRVSLLTGSPEVGLSQPCNNVSKA